MISLRLLVAIVLASQLVYAQSDEPVQFCLLGGNIFHTTEGGKKIVVSLPENIKVVNLGPSINSQYADYCPTVAVDGNTLYFISGREGSVKNKKGEPSHDIWATNINKVNALPDTKPFNVDPTSKYGPLGLNTHMNEGTLTVTRDGNTLFFAGCNRSDGFGSCDIYKSTKQSDGTWGQAINLGKQINTTLFESQPSVTPDGKRLYFVSNRLSKEEDELLDNLIHTRNETSSREIIESINKRIDELYVSHIYFTDYDEVTQSWGTPQRIDALCTKLGEVGPSICSDSKTLLYSTGGLPDSHGGLDFYVTRLADDGTWLKSANLGQPINTNSADMFIAFSSTNNVVYFGSNRTDIAGFQGGMDLYMAYVPQQCALHTNADKSASDAKSTTSTPASGTVNLRFDTNGGSVKAIVEGANSMQASLKIYDLVGREVETVFDGVLPSNGKIEIPLNFSSLSSGVYFFNLVAGSTSLTQGFSISK